MRVLRGEGVMSWGCELFGEKGEEGGSAGVGEKVEEKAARACAAILG